MNMLRRLFQLTVIVALTGALWVSVPAARADSTITVTVTEETLNNNGNCSLREAVQAANTNAAVDLCAPGTGFDTIAFNIPAVGVQLITLTSSLVVTAPVAIDARTQPGGGPVPMIHLTGNFSGLIDIAPGANGSSVRGLQFTNTFPGPSRANDLIVRSDNVIVTANYFNTDGAVQMGTYAAGIEIMASGVQVGGDVAGDRNLFGGRDGVHIDSGAHNVVQGNYFGVTNGGSLPLGGGPGAGSGISVLPSLETSSYQTIRGNVIGNYDFGVFLRSPTHDNLIAGNYIGVGADGASTVSNGIGVLGGLGVVAEEAVV